MPYSHSIVDFGRGRMKYATDARDRFKSTEMRGEGIELTERGACGGEVERGSSGVCLYRVSATPLQPRYSTTYLQCKHIMNCAKAAQRRVRASSPYIVQQTASRVFAVTKLV